VLVAVRFGQVGQYGPLVRPGKLLTSLTCFLPAVLGLADLGPREVVYMEAGYGEHQGPGRTRALRRPGSKYIQRLTDWARYPRGPLTLFWAANAYLEGGLARDEYYDLRADPDETANLLRKRPGAARRDRELLEGLGRQLGSEALESSAARREGLSPEALESLRSLGYIHW
jgi:hypothetical protein